MWHENENSEALLWTCWVKMPNTELSTVYILNKIFHRSWYCLVLLFIWAFVLFMRIDARNGGKGTDREWAFYCVPLLPTGVYIILHTVPYTILSLPSDLHTTLFSQSLYNHRGPACFNLDSSSHVLRERAQSFLAKWTWSALNTLYLLRSCILQKGNDVPFQRRECLAEGADAKEAVWYKICTMIQKHMGHYTVIAKGANFA